MIRVVLGGVPAIVCGYGFVDTLRTWVSIDFLKQDDLISTGIVSAVGSIVCLWGLWRRRHPARWVEVNTKAKTLELGLGGPPKVLKLADVGELKVEKYLFTKDGRRKTERFVVVAAGLPGVHLFDSLYPNKAEAFRARLEQLLR